MSGNRIGTNAGGTAKLGNTLDGVYISDGAQSNTIGGDAAGEGNLISGNNQHGVEIYYSDTTSNTVSGNLIGTNITGTGSLGNAGDGVYISYYAQNNTIGGDSEGERNVISGNDWYGVRIAGSGVTGNVVSGNYIGTNITGTGYLGNTGDGVYISYYAQNNTIGGDTAGERNVISGNEWHGVEISGYGTMSNTVSGNYIGTDASGAARLGNVQDGVHIGNAQNNTVGGDTAGERNVISGNDGCGVYLDDGGTTGNVVSGNYIGVAANGTAGLGNDDHGVFIYYDGAQDNVIGPGNVIAHNEGDGVEVYGAGASRNTITHNSIYSNTMGIDLVNGANGDIAAPVIVTTTAGSVNVVGTACANCTVEVFVNSDTDGEGETYVGSGTATAGGDFTVTVSSLSKPYLTATATDAISNTSEFSAVFTSTVTGSTVYLPIILKSY